MVFFFIITTHPKAGLFLEQKILLMKYFIAFSYRRHTIKNWNEKNKSVRCAACF